MIIGLLTNGFLTVIIGVMSLNTYRIVRIARRRFEKIEFLENVIDHKDDQIEELMKRNMRDSYLLRDQDYVISEVRKKNEKFAMKDKEEAECKL